MNLWMEMTQEEFNNIEDKNQCDGRLKIKEDKFHVAIARLKTELHFRPDAQKWAMYIKKEEESIIPEIPTEVYKKEVTYCTSFPNAERMKLSIEEHKKNLLNAQKFNEYYHECLYYLAGSSDGTYDKTYFSLSEFIAVQEEFYDIMCQYKHSQDNELEIKEAPKTEPEETISSYCDLEI